MDKTILLMFICEYNSPYYKQSFDVLKTINFQTSIPTSKGGHNGLSIQVLLDLNIDKSLEFCNNIINLFPVKPLILISKVNVIMKQEPIGEWYNDDLVKNGRNFDDLYSNNKRGIFINK